MENAEKNYGAIILDNGGGITLQLGEFACYRQDAGLAAADISAWIEDADTSDWEGHDEDAAKLDPDQNQIRNGGYRVVRLDRGVDNLESLAKELHPIGWGNAENLAAELSALANA